MKILIAQPWLTRGGSEVIALQIAYSLQKRGHRVKVIAIAKDLSSLPSFTKKLDIITIPYGEFLRKQKWLFLVMSLPLLTFLFLRFGRWADILNPHNAPTLWASLWTSILFKKPIIWWCSDLPDYKKMQSQTLFDFILSKTTGSLFDKWVVSKVRTILVFSIQMKQRVKKIYQKDAIVIECGPDEDYFQRRTGKTTLFPQKFVLLCIGKLHPQKNQKLAMLALKNVLSKIPHAYLVLVGNGNRKSLLQFAKKNNVEKHIFFAGFISEKMLFDYYSSSNVVLFPSVEQSWGLVPLEALLMEKIPIISSESAVSDYLEKRKIGIVSKPTPQKFAQAIISAYNHPKETEVMIALGRNFIKNDLSWNKTAKIIEKVLINVSNENS